ncbi:MAG TPA: hypothetical protein VH815_03225, partial [Acidobacteriota bacterium]
MFLVLARFVLPKLFPEATLFGMPLLFLGVMAGAACGIFLVIWWLFFSRAPWSERILAVLLMVGGIFITRYLVHVSIRSGAMGFLLFILIIPAICIAFVIWALASRNLSTGMRRVTLVAAIVISCGIFTLIRTNGLTGEGQSDLKWRWSKTDEEKLLAQQNEKEEPITPATSIKAPEQTQPEATVTQTQ